MFTNRNSYKISFLALGVLFMATLFTACGMGTVGSNPGQKTKDGQGIFISTGGEFQLTAGEEWQAMTGELHPEAELEIGSLAKDKYLIVIPESKADLAMPLADYTNIVVDLTAAKLTNRLITDPAPTTINGRAAYVSKISGMVDGLNVYYWVYTVDCPDHLVQIIAWTLKSRKESYDADIAAIVQSFCLTPPSPAQTEVAPTEENAKKTAPQGK